MNNESVLSRINTRSFACVGRTLLHYSSSLMSRSRWTARVPSNLVYPSSTGSARASSPVRTRRTTNRQIDVPAERHVRRNITLKPGNVSKNRDATGRQDFAQWREAYTSTLLTKSDQRIPSIWRWHFMWKVSNAFMSVARRVQVSAACINADKTRAS